MKCKDCKFCAFINEYLEEMTITGNVSTPIWFSDKGAHCMKTQSAMLHVEECSGYEKIEDKKEVTIKEYTLDSKGWLGAKLIINKDNELEAIEVIGLDGKPLKKNIVKRTK